MANYGGYQQYNYATPNNGYQSPMPQGNPPIPPPYPSPSAQPLSAPHSPYQSQSGYNRPPPPPPGQPQSPYPGQMQQPYQQPYGAQQNQYQQQYQSYGQSQYGQGQYGQQPPYGNPYGKPQGQQYGAPGQQQQYGAPPPGGQYGAPQQQAGPPGDANAYRQLLQACIQERNLQHFYPQGSPIVEQIAQRAPQQVGQVISAWKLPKELANDIVKLALYDIILYVDDSGSMQFEEGGERIKDLKVILERVAFAATLFDSDGISVRFMNTDLPPNMQDNVSTEAHINNIMNGVQFKGLTPMGTSLKRKVVDELIGKARANQLRKPALVITITDGQPAGEPQDAVFKTIREAVNALPPGGIAFQFAQVGNDQTARQFLGKLDEDPDIGRLVDCTSNFENEQEEMMKAIPPVDMTPDMWMMKLLLGAIDSSYDAKDERTKSGAGGYGAPPQQGYGYGQAMGGYGGPPPQQYGQQQQYPPPGQYPPQGQPPHGQQQQYPQGQPPHGQQYGAPPQQGRGGGYPGQAQYGAPPPGGRY